MGGFDIPTLTLIRRAAFYAATSLAILSCSAFAQSASAATISYDGATQHLRYTAAAGETNFLLVTQDGGDYVFTDSGSVAITAAAGVNPCSVDPISQNVARCTAADIRRIAVFADDNDDWIRMQVAPPEGTVLSGDAGHDIIEGSNGPDMLYGGTGADRMIGNAGNDTFDTGHGGYDP